MSEPNENGLVSATRLMRAFDGELDEAALAAVDAQPEAENTFSGLEQVGDFVRAMADEWHPPASMVDDIMKRVEAEPRLRVLAAASENRDEGSGRWARRAGALGALAAAAAAVFVIAAARDSGPSPLATAIAPTEAPVRTAPQAVASVASPAAMVDDEGSPAAAIESVDFGGNTGAIFMVSGGSGTTPVIWVDDRGRAEPL